MSLLKFIGEKAKMSYPTKSIGMLVEGITTVPDNSLPIAPMTSEWYVLEGPERLVRTFEFHMGSHLRYFLNELLDYQDVERHSATITINDKSVTVETFTHDLEQVTLSDKKLARFCDEIFEDTKLLNYSTTR